MAHCTGIIWNVQLALKRLIFDRGIKERNSRKK
jgi:hypothetical protein